MSFKIFEHNPDSKPVNYIHNTPYSNKKDAEKAIEEMKIKDAELKYFSVIYKVLSFD